MARRRRSPTPLARPTPTGDARRASGSGRRAFRTADALDLVGAAFGSFCLALADLRAAHAAVGRARLLRRLVRARSSRSSWFLAREPPRRAARRATSWRASWSAPSAIGLLIPLAIIVGYTIVAGLPRAAPAVLHAGPAARSARSSRRPTGGGSAAIVGSLEMVGIATLLSRPARHRDRDLPQRDRRAAARARCG